MLAPMIKPLTTSEMIVLAGAVREMMKADGTVTDAELQTAGSLAPRLGLPAEQWESLWSQAMRDLPNFDAVKAAAGALHRQEARELVYEILHEVATHDEIVDSEWDLLEWLDEMWRFTDEKK